MNIKYLEHLITDAKNAARYYSTSISNNENKSKQKYKIAKGILRRLEALRISLNKRDAYGDLLFSESTIKMRIQDILSHKNNLGIIPEMYLE